jgi:peptidoglycan L-alanyl-D-glutamate endopeptidase CwlK
VDNISEAHLADVHPELARRIRQLANKCLANGTIIRVTCGVRNWADQDDLYAQGRSEPGKIVTDARGGWSAHNFGYAVDIVPADPAFPAFVPDWNAMDPRWKMVLLVAKSCGLAEGAQWRTFPDKPHLYLLELPADPTQGMREAFQNGGIQKVWEIFEQGYHVTDLEAT